MRHVVLIVSAVVICAGCWTEQEVVSNVTTDTDSDSDSDTDTDSDSDTETDSDNYECNAPEGITDWGGPCHTPADCPPNTYCHRIGSIDTTQGFCTAECCNFNTEDPAYCTDVAAGQEGCYIGSGEESPNFGPPYYCIIVCNTQADCPTGTACTDTGGSMSICYGYAS